MSPSDLDVEDLGRTDYEDVWQRMRDYTDDRGTQGRDALWLTEHNPVYTLGQSGKREHILFLPSDIPLVHSDRGGQVTYHGPGQIVAYFMVDLKRLHLSVHDFVCQLEQTMIDTLSMYGIEGERLPKNPGVYVNGKKIGALGIRVRRGCTYHGISLNVDMDLSVFDAINPCGIVGMQTTHMRKEGLMGSLEEVQQGLIESYRKLASKVDTTV